MERNKTKEQGFYGNVGQVAGGNIINIHAAPEQPDPDVIRCVAELLTLAKANNILDTIQNISQIQYSSRHFKGLKLWQLKKLVAITQEIIVLKSTFDSPATKKRWWLLFFA